MDRDYFRNSDASYLVLNNSTERTVYDVAEFEIQFLDLEEVGEFSRRLANPQDPYRLNLDYHAHPIGFVDTGIDRNARIGEVNTIKY